jgi:hypothetical protein
MPTMSTKMPMALLSAALLASACAPAPESPAAEQSPPSADATAAATAERRVPKKPRGSADQPGFIEQVAYAGSGCDGNSATSAPSPDNQVVTSTFSAFLADAGPGSEGDAATRNCLITMNINVPSGWSYSLESVDFRGFAALDSGVTATRKSLYMIAGSPVHVTPPARWKGPISDNFNQPDVGPGAPGVWSPCGGGQVLMIATEATVDNHSHQDRAGQLTIDTIDTELTWRRCQ